MSHDANHAHITISDNGENIPQDKLDKIFERFYQTPSHTNDRNVGTGIGLDLTRSLVELHYGAIKAENLTPSNASSYLENSQSGVLFTVSIPLGNSHLKPEEMMESQEEEVVNPMAELEDIEAAVPWALMVRKGSLAFSASSVGVVAFMTMLPSSSFDSPTPSITTSTTGFFINGVPPVDVF